jgi:hypothetical protein
MRAHSEIETSGTRTTSLPGFQGLDLNLPDGSTSLDISLGTSGAISVEIDEVKSALERLVQNVVTNSANTSMSGHPSPEDLKMKGSHTSLKVARVTNGVKAKRYEYLSDLDTTMEEDEPLDDHGDPQHETPNVSTTSSAQQTPELLSGGGFMSPSLSRTTSESSNVVPPPPKDAIRSREQMILEKRREIRRREQDEDLGYVTPPRNPPVGRPSARRSMSTGDAEDLQAAARLAALNPPGTSVLPDVVVTEEKDPLAESIARELRKLRGSTKNVSLAVVASRRMLM